MPPPDPMLLPEPDPPPPMPDPPMPEALVVGLAVGMTESPAVPIATGVRLQPVTTAPAAARTATATAARRTVLSYRVNVLLLDPALPAGKVPRNGGDPGRSEERRVGKEWGSGGALLHG